MTCVYRHPASGGDHLLGCLEDLPAGPVHFEMPGPPPADYTHFPAPGDVIVVEFDGAEAGRVRLPERYQIHLPVVRR
jgi:hypothetical protein